jgi:hypothetical protein
VPHKSNAEETQAQGIFEGIYWLKIWSNHAWTPQTTIFRCTDLNNLLSFSDLVLEANTSTRNWGRHRMYNAAILHPHAWLTICTTAIIARKLDGTGHAQKLASRMPDQWREGRTRAPKRLWEIVMRLWESVRFYWHTAAHLHTMVTVRAKHAVHSSRVSSKTSTRSWTVPWRKMKIFHPTFSDDEKNSCHLTRTCCVAHKQKVENFKLNNSKFVVGCIEPGQKRHRSCSCGSGPRWIIVIWHEFCGIKRISLTSLQNNMTKVNQKMWMGF